MALSLYLGPDEAVAGRRRHPKSLRKRQHARVLRLLPLALRMARSYAKGHPGWRLDLVGAAQLGLCRAVRDYTNHSRRSQITLLIYASWRIRKHLIREARWLRDSPRNFGDSEADPAGIAEPESDPWPDWLEDAWSAMPPVRREIVERRLRCHTYQEVADDLGLSHQAVRSAFLYEIRLLREGGPRKGRHPRHGLD